MPHRLKDIPPPGEEIRIDAFGESIPAYAGETVAAALLAAGKQVFSRSVKYHRPRGPFCLTGRCSHCLTRIGGVPNQFACRTRCTPNLRVEAQNVLGSPKWDALSAIDFLFPRGLDHHEMFAGVPVVEKAVAGVARHLAGLGTLPSAEPAPVPPAEVRRCQVAVIGGGPTGLALASALARGGSKVELIDEARAPGGRLLCQMADELDDAWVSRAVAAVSAGGVLHSETTALGAYRDGEGRYLLLRTESPERLIKLYADQFAVCMGGTENLPLFENNDLPGVFAARGLLKLVWRQGVVPGERAVVVAEHAEGMRVAASLQRAGVEIAAVVSAAPLSADNVQAPLIVGQVLKAQGNARVEKIRVTRADSKTQTVDCDLIVCATPVAPSFEIARQLGVRAGQVSRGFAPEAHSDGSTTIPGVFAAGEVVEELSAAQAAARGAALAARMAQEKGP